MTSDLLRFDGALAHDPAIDLWFAQRPGPLGDLARHWFQHMRACGDEVRELVHDGCPVACLGDFPFAYVHVFAAHVNVGFYRGASLPDPTHILLGSGKRMRHVKLQPGTSTHDAALHQLIRAAWAHIKSRVEHG